MGRVATLLLLCVSACAKEPAPKPLPSPLSSGSASVLASVTPPVVASESPKVAPAPAPCTADAGVIDVFLKREMLPAKPPDKALPGIVLVAPTLGLRVELLALVAPASCSTMIFGRAEKMAMTCTFSPGTSTFEVRREPERLVFPETHHEIATPQIKTEYHAPVVVPCGARLVFHPVTWRDPKWVGFGDPCPLACSDKHFECRAPCITNLTDEKGELTEEGSKCADRCAAASKKCEARCPP